MKEAQYFVSANQRVWAGALSERLAYTWNEDSRANRLLDLMPEVIRDPKSGQIDHQSPHLMQFLKMARSLVPADELCGGVNSELRLSCLEHVSGIDAWNGQMNLDSWQASLVALWISSFRRALVPKNAFQHKAMPVLFKEWSKSSNAVRALEALMAKPEQRLLLEKELGRSFDDLVRESFRGAYAYFLNLGGSQLEWGFMHRTRWQHPFGLIPGALGVALRDSLLGPPRALPGAFDSPSAFNWVWDPKEPADFAVEHGPAMRMCTEFRADGSLVTEWAASTGPSGNPFSKWSRVFADETYFEETWVKTGLDTLSPR
jgi:acyl-homoserine lactone acylase PvdQ